METGQQQSPKIIFDGRMKDVVSCKAELNNVVHMIKQRRMAEDVKFKFTNQTQWYLEKGMPYSFPSQVYVLRMLKTYYYKCTETKGTYFNKWNALF